MTVIPADQIWDVIVVGAGTAGLPTAIFAGRRGARVLLIEAADRIGGALHLSSGSLSAAGTKRQKEKGIDDSPENQFNDSLRISHGTGDRTVLRLWHNNAAKTFDWLMDQGLDVPDSDPILNPAHEFYNTPRTYTPKKQAIAYLELFTPMLQEQIDSGAVTLALDTRISRLIRSEDGAVTGIEAEGPDGKVVATGKSVVLTTGGYLSNPVMWRELHGQPLYSYGWPHAQGDGHKAAEAIGANIRHAENFLPTFGAIHDIDEPGKYWIGSKMLPSVRDPWEVFVDDKGRRFIREDCPSVDERERALLRTGSLTFWTLFDEAIHRDAPQFYFWPEEKLKRAFDKAEDFLKADTLEDLAKAMGVDPTVLAHTVREYNQAQAAGSDALGRKFMPAPIAEGPFYAVRTYGTSVTSFAGVGVNGDLNVLDAEDRPIQNLYAAGEVLGMGVFGHSFLGGSTISSSITFGRLLGGQILKW